MPSILLPFFPVKSAILLCCALPAIPTAALLAAEMPAGTLPFAPEVISRLSLDGKPRSLAIRQGADVWLGYDLERGTIQKAWRAPPGKPGLIRGGFTTRSTGITWFEDRSDAAWTLQRGTSTVPLSIRYLGCSHREDHIELRWELRHDAGSVQLRERVPLKAAEAADRVVRELRAEDLAVGESLVPPAPVRQEWKWGVGPAATVPALVGNLWHRLTLP